MGKYITVRKIWKAILVVAFVLAATLCASAIFATDWVANASNKVLLALQGAEAFTIAVCVFCIYQLLQGRKYRVLLSAVFGSACAMLGIALRFLLTHQFSVRMMLFDLVGIALGLVVAMLQPNVNKFLKVCFYEELNKNANKREKLENLLDVLSLAAAFAYVGYCFLLSTTFPLILTNTLRYFVAALIICGGLRFSYYFLRKVWSIEDEPARLKLVGKTALVFFVAIPFVLSGVVSERDQLTVLPLLMLCLWHMQPEKVLRSYALVVGTLLAATVLCCLAGCIRNISSFDGKSSYGIINTTDFAAYFIFLLLCIWCTQRVRTWYATLFIAALTVAVAAVTYYLAGSRTTVICCVMIVLACAWEWTVFKLAEKSKLIDICKKAVDSLCIGAFPLTVVALSYITHAFSKGAPWALRLDELLSHRIKPLWEVFNKQGIHMLGKVFKMHGQGSSVLGPGATYDFLDSGYAYLLIRNGVLIFVTVACLWVWMSWCAVRGGRRRFVLALAIVAFYGFSECQMINVNYNIFLAMPFCAFAASLECEEASKAEAKKWLISLAVGVFLAAIVFLFAPKMLSWFRTAFFLLGWTNSYRSFWALVFVVVVIVCFLLIRKVLPHAMQEVVYMPERVLVAILFVLAIGALWMNSVIQRGVEMHSAELDAEEEAIMLIQSSTTQPVYAAEKSELYQRRFGGIKDYVMAPDDLTRIRKGTILVDKGHDSIWLVETGARYVQYSKTSGLYTYDPAVIKTLEASGKTSSRFNNSEHMSDLDDLARLNNLMRDEHGGLEFIGPSHSLNENRVMDQAAGSYVVQLIFHADPSRLKESGKEQICIFRAMANRDENLVVERQIRANEFDKLGHLSIAVPYICKAPTPRLQYTIVAADDVTVYVDKISWKRVA